MTGTATQAHATESAARPTGPVLFCYDGSDLARLAIDEAGRQLEHRRDALVVCVWQPADVGFIPVDGKHLNTQQATDVEQAALATAARGAELAEQAGFHAQSCAVEMAPTWKGIVKAANDRDASLIVLGAHRRSGIVGHLLGSVTAAVVTHSTTPVLVVHPQR